MMILFFFESTWAGIKYSIVYDIFSTAGFIFDILYKLIGGGSQFAYSITPDELSKVLYTVAGIFMLFRATIGLIQMLVNPDQTNDKQAGAGKLIMRIVVSIVLLILFTPGNYLIGKDGLLSRTEDAIVGNNGFLIKVFDELGWTPEDEDLSSSSKIKKSDLLVENVDAASNWTKTCYYYPGRYCGQNFKENGKTNQCRRNDNFLKVEFSNTKKDGSVPLTCSGKTCKYDNGATANISKIYVRFIKSTETIKVKDKTYQQEFKKLKLNKMDFKTNQQNPKPTAIKYPEYKMSQVQNCNNWRISNGNNSINPNANWIIEHVKFTGVSNGGSYTFGYNDWFGTNSLNELYKVVKYSKDILAPGVNSGGPEDGLDGKIDNEEKNKFERDASKVFVSRAMGSFENCVSNDEEKDSNCEQLKAQQFEKLNTQTAKDLTDAMVDGSLELDFMMGTIGGVLCIVFLSLLCVDVIVRQLKLWILQILAPIPIVCYVDPKDKVFMQWLKTFAAVYVDLFIKLFALEVAIYLLSSDNFDLLQHNVSGIGNFFLIIAILVFAKGLPGMISKIFGIDGMGSFKEIGGMLKAGTNFGAGAILGSAAGFASGRGLGRIASLGTGAIMGAGAGAKGNVLGGVKNITGRNAKINQQKDDGLNLAERMLVSFGETTGLALGGKAATRMEKANAVYEAQGKYKKYMTDQIKNKNTQFAAINDGSGGILDKGKHRVIASAGEAIDMKTEYARQDNLANMSIDSWNSMSVSERKSEFGSLAGGQSSLTEAQVFQNERVAALEDYAIPEMARSLYNKNDGEAIKEYRSYADAVSNAQSAGVKIDSLPEMNKFNNKTISTSKDQAIDGYNKASSSSSVKIQQHINKS